MYHIEDLRARVDMLEKLASSIDLIYENLKGMARELTTGEIILE